MSIKDLKDNYQRFKKNPGKVLSYIILGMICGISGSFFGGFFSEKGRQFAEATSSLKSVKIEMPVEDGMEHTLYNLKDEVGGRYVGQYVSADSGTTATVHESGTSSLQFTPRKK